MTDKNSAAAISEAELEALRESARARANVARLLTAAAVPVYFWFVYSRGLAYDDNFPFMLAKTALFTAVAASGTFGALRHLLARRAHSRFVESFKAKYVVPALGAIPGFAGLEFRSRDGFSWEEVREAAVVRCGDRKYFRREDMLTGLYRGARFRISDVTARREVKKKEKREIETLFDGQVFCFERFNERKKSAGFVQLFQKELFSDFGGARARHAVMTENAAFNDKFKIFADDEHNAYYILTPRLIAAIMEFSEAAGAPVNLSFVGEKLYGAVKRRGMFVPKLDVPVSEQALRLGGDVAVLRKAAELLVEGGE